MKKKFKENKKFRLIVIAAVTIFLVAGFSLAWFVMRTTDLNQLLSVSNFDAVPYCYFVDSNGNELPEASTDANGLIKLSTDSNATNYIGNFRVRVKYKGLGVGYLRVKMAHKFNAEGAGAAQNTVYIPYQTDANTWYDNRGNDFCYYYKEQLKATSNADYSSKELISGFNPDGFIENIAEGIEIRVAVETDMVQINRYPQLWDIDKLPWK